MHPARSKSSHLIRARAFRMLLPILLLLALLAACGSSPDQSAHSGAGPTPTPRSISSSSPTSLPAPSEPDIKTPAITDNTLSITTAGDVTYAGTVDQGLFALRSSNGTLLWRSSMEGAVTELPLVDNNVVYISSFIGEIGPATLTAVRAVDGRVLWKYHNSGYISRPVIQNGVVYLTAQQDGVIALRVSDGKQLWQFKSPIDQGPQLANGVLYVVSNTGGFYALRTSDGKIIWRDESIIAQNLTYSVQGGMVFAFSESNVIALRASDGRKLWSSSLDSSFTQIPQLSAGVLYFVATKISLETPTPTPTVFPSPAPTKRGSSQISRPAFLNLPFQKQASVVITRLTTYMKQGKSSVYALRVSDGKLLWQDRLNQGNNSYASALQIGSGSVYVAALDAAGGYSSSIISALSKQDGHVIWQRTAGGSMMDANLTGDMLYLSVDFQGRSVVYALKALDGTLHWSYAIDGDTFNGLVLGNKMLYIGSTNGIAYALRSDNGTLAWHYRTKGGENA